MFGGVCKSECTTFSDVMGGVLKAEGEEQKNEDDRDEDEGWTGKSSHAEGETDGGNLHEWAGLSRSKR